jgi:predicted deacylase
MKLKHRLKEIDKLNNNKDFAQKETIKHIANIRNVVPLNNLVIDLYCVVCYHAICG